jgi:hypothetical protein
MYGAVPVNALLVQQIATYGDVVSVDEDGASQKQHDKKGYNKLVHLLPHRAKTGKRL